MPQLTWSPTQWWWESSPSSSLCSSTTRSSRPWRKTPWHITRYAKLKGNIHPNNVHQLHPHLVDLQAGPDHDSPAVRGGGGPHSVPHTQGCHQYLRIISGEKQIFKSFFYFPLCWLHNKIVKTYCRFNKRKCFEFQVYKKSIFTKQGSAGWL